MDFTRLWTRLTAEGMEAPDGNELAALEAQVRDELAAGPKHDGWYRALAEICGRLGCSKEALAVLLPAAEHRPDGDGQIQAALGTVWWRLGWLDRAREAYLRAVDQSPRQLGWWYHLARLEKAKGGVEASKNAFRELLRREEEGGQPFQRRDLLFRLAYSNQDLPGLYLLGFDKRLVDLLAVTQNLPAEDPAEAARLLRRRVLLYRRNATLRPDLLVGADYVRELYAEHREVRNIFRNGAFHLEDFTGRHTTIRDGFRGAPEEAAGADEKIIYLAGNSIAFGAHSEDSLTLGPLLRDHCRRAGHRILVKSLATLGLPLASGNLWRQVLSLPLRPGDEVWALVAGQDRPGGEEWLAALDESCRSRGALFRTILYPRLGDIDRPTRLEKDLRTLAGLLMDEPSPPTRTGGPSTMERFAAGLVARGIRVLDLQPAVDRRPAAAREVFVDVAHLGPNGHCLAAEYLFSALIAPAPQSGAGLPRIRRAAGRWLASTICGQYAGRPEVQSWLEGARAATPVGPGPFGAMVMNCNPFTRGHLYIIEKAVELTGGLYVFIVEEDLSDFSFPDRLAMVRAGTAHLGDRVAVLPGGRFIISSFSFPGYFSKARALNPDEVDSSLDVAIFGGLIAPALGIDRRLVGEEPHCLVTAGYNRTMLDLLPSMGVTVTVIPRREEEGAPISASAVRRALAAGDLDRARRLTPPSTWPYLGKGGAIAA